MTSDYQHISHGFEPVFDGRSRVLVLGSFPSVLSRENAFYYGNPQNRFWRVIAACVGEPTPPSEGEPLLGDRFVAPFGEESPADDGHATFLRKEPLSTGETRPATLGESIEAKRALLLRHGIALWDVIESCDIKGSSDASIKNVVPVRIERVTGAAPVQAVVCNGGTAGRLYKRYLQVRVGIEAVVLPSTSPANAAWSLERLVAHWDEELRPLLALK